MRNPTAAHSWNPAPGRKLTEHRLTKSRECETEWLLLFSIVFIMFEVPHFFESPMQVGVQKM